MPYLLLHNVFTFLLDLFSIISLADKDIDLEILLLCRQIRILQRQERTQPHLGDVDRFFLSFLVVQFKRSAVGAQQYWKEAVLLFKPDTVLRWHRELVHRKWNYQRRKKAGQAPNLL